MEGVIVDYHRVDRMLRALIAQSLIVDRGKAPSFVCSPENELLTKVLTVVL